MSAFAPLHGPQAKLYLQHIKQTWVLAKASHLLTRMLIVRDARSHSQLYSLE